MATPPLLAQSQVGFTWLDTAVVCGYLVVMFAMGLWIALQQQSTEDYFLGGRRLPSWAVGISLLASLLSTITYLGMPGEMFRTGLSFLTRQLGVPIVLVVVWFLWLPFFMRLKLTSAYEYLERRFNYPARVLAAVICLVLLLGWMAVVVLTAAKAMSEIVVLDLPWFFGVNHAEARDADIHAIILGIGLVSVVYTSMGGMKAVVWTDVIQFFVLIGGALFTIAFVAWTTGSFIGQWAAEASQYPYREQVQWASFDIGNRSTVLFLSINMIFWFICTHGANQVALQRYFAVTDVWQARKSYLTSAVASFGLGIILAVVGLALMYYIQQPAVTLPAEAFLEAEQVTQRYTAQDQVFPQFIRYYLPTGFRGLVVAALFAAAMSTIDSGANSIATIVTVDFVNRLGRAGDDNQRRELRSARLLTATLGLLLVIATISLYRISKGTDIISLMQKGFNCFLGPLGALFVLAMFSRRATAATVIPAVLIGELTGVLASYSDRLFDFEFSTHLVVPVSWGVTILVGVGLEFLLPSRPSAEQLKWTWRSVVHSPDSLDSPKPAGGGEH